MMMMKTRIQSGFRCDCWRKRTRQKKKNHASYDRPKRRLWRRLQHQQHQRSDQLVVRRHLLVGQHQLLVVQFVVRLDRLVVRFERRFVQLVDLDQRRFDQFACQR